jgi:putative DNA primase/helicase
MIVESERRKYNKFASTIDELWQIIKKADAAGHTTYHACASYKEARHDSRGTPPAKRRYGRTKINALGAKAFWLDVDAGPGKPYANWRPAAEAIAAFCKATGLPRPVLVFSGLGLHVYWPLNRTVDPETWKRYALGLKALCEKHGLHADPARTADISSVLRTPGTHHRKAGERLVQCGELVGPYSIEQFDFLLLVGSSDSAPKPYNPFEALGPLPSYLRHTIGESVAEGLLRSLSTAFEPSFSSLIVERCAQVRALRDTKGNLTEPRWYAVLGVLTHAVDGEPLAHAWSSGDPRYTESETQERLDRARQFGPTKCARFRDLNPGGCKRCPWWRKIKSPVVLGRRQIATGRRA